MSDGRSSGPREIPSPQALVGAAVVFEGGMGLLAAILAWWAEIPLGSQIVWNPAALAWGMAGAVPLVGVLAVFLWAQWRPLARLRQLTDEYLVPLFRDCRLLELAVIALLAGVGEELLFRGVVLQSIAGAVGPARGVWVGLAASSMVFGAAHLITPAYGLLAGLIGFYLGCLWLATGTLTVPIVAHAMYDFVALVYLAKIRGRRLSPVEQGRSP